MRKNFNLTIIILSNLLAILYGQIISSSTNEKPDDTWRHVCSEGSRCRITDNSGEIKYGMIAYGAAGIFAIMPFKNDPSDRVNYFEFNCDNEIGDIAHGYAKKCSYKYLAKHAFIGRFPGVEGPSAAKDYNDPMEHSVSWSKLCKSADGKKCGYRFTSRLKVGLIGRTGSTPTNNHWDPWRCKSSNMGNVFPDVRGRMCYQTVNSIMNIGKYARQNWVWCADERHMCTVTEAGMYLVLYAMANKDDYPLTNHIPYVSRIVKTSEDNTQFYCGGDWTNDPYVGLTKRCFLLKLGYYSRSPTKRPTNNPFTPTVPPSMTPTNSPSTPSPTHSPTTRNFYSRDLKNVLTHCGVNPDEAYTYALNYIAQHNHGSNSGFVRFGGILSCNEYKRRIIGDPNSKDKPVSGGGPNDSVLKVKNSLITCGITPTSAENYARNYIHRMKTVENPADFGDASCTEIKQKVIRKGV